jgi:hypothetical protein
MVRRHRGDGDAVQGGTAMAVEVAAGAAVLAAMLCVSWYGWVSLPGDARVPIHITRAGAIRVARNRSGA